MVLQLFICLLVIASASLLITQGRRRRIWSILIFAGLGILAYFFMENLSRPQTTNFIYQWLPYEELRADINISSSRRMQHMFLPLTCLLAGLVYLNTLFASEKHSLHFNTLMLLNFVSLILQASSHDFLQLMFAGCMFSIISFYMPDQILAKKKIFIFNFLAEMAVFMALAIVYGKTSSVSLTVLPEYASGGRHRDLVAFLLLFAIGCKCGLFLLNGHYFSLKDAAFNRIICVMALSVPLSGLILTDKLRPLLQISDLTINILPWWSLLSVVLGLTGALINNNLKSKVVSLSLAVYAFMLPEVYFNSGRLQIMVPWMLIFNTLAAAIFVIVSNAASGENNAAYLGGFWRGTKGNFVLTLLLCAALGAGFASHSSGQGFMTFTTAYMIVLALDIKMAYWGRPRADEKVMAFAQNAGILYWLPLVAVSFWLIWQNTAWKNIAAYELLAVPAVLLAGMPVLWLIRLGGMKIWQTDVLSGLYERLIILPLKFLGRVLWLVFDFVVIERSIIGTISAAASALVTGVRKIQEARCSNYILSILSGILIMLVYWGFYAYE